MHELDLVVLTHPVPDYGLQQGDVGTVVHVYHNAQAYEVEFVTAEGVTLAVLTLAQKAVRPLAAREILHVRDLAA
ncbi:hypothetical protein OSCT_2516 [Oscillochloris trichoides DG-6]|uniref:DUF4926 domain-containing protein n=1 Tax=Oscillochloris trichoides DG-6 TaxID=765420 RepID=E1IGR5_9CHLR|nr:DUF4926 domain-containing protein [Oscillochloris trichoides]EFO79652.1 hypothetical protein OSCT_2516 [Oscillochloris trichoides DG-6]